MHAISCTQLCPWLTFGIDDGTARKCARFAARLSGCLRGEFRLFGRGRGESNLEVHLHNYIFLHFNRARTPSCTKKTSLYKGLAPKSDNETMCWLENKQLLAAPASRRLGRAGLEAPPLRGQKILSF